MSFIDHDLKNLKALFKGIGKGEGGGIPSLIARLDAAEELAKVLYLQCYVSPGCRGHFKDFSHGAGLFGKHKGTYWWPMASRGNKAFGEIVKDYKILAVTGR